MTARRSIEFIRSEVEKAGYTLLDNHYVNNKTKMNLMCPKHGHFKMEYAHIRKGCKCP
jgi:hypothetical protein